MNQNKSVNLAELEADKLVTPCVPHRWLRTLSQFVRG